MDFRGHTQMVCLHNRTRDLLARREEVRREPETDEQTTDETEG